MKPFEVVITINDERNYDLLITTLTAGLVNGYDADQRAYATGLMVNAVASMQLANP